MIYNATVDFTYRTLIGLQKKQTVFVQLNKQCDVLALQQAQKLTNKDIFEINSVNWE